MSATTRILSLCLLISLAAVSLFGQGGAYGTILGTVKDNSGAVVTKASVDVTNVATNVTQHTETTSSGDFTVPYLAPGTYRVTVQSAGFQKSVLDNIGLVVGQEARADVTLKAGAVTESVSVEANAVALDTENAAVSQLVSEKQVDELPLNGRNFLNLLFIGAGAVQTVGEQGQMRQNEGNAISINGGRPESNNYTLDGLSNTDTALNTPAVILSQDAIQEFKVQSETYTAEYGFSANQINIVSKSGSNQLHGSLFLFDRNDAFDAKAHFQPEIPELRQNQFGFVAGGPVYIPKLYDGRNKTFWLANYEGWRIRNGTNQFYNVPTTAELNGDFSALNLPAYDATPGSPCQVALASNNPCMPVDPNTGAAFTGNMIQSSRFVKLPNVALGANIFSAPNCTGCSLGNFHLVTTLPTVTDQQTYKVDQNLGRLGSVFFRYTKADYSLENAGTASIGYGLNTFTENSTSWAVSHTITLGHSMVNSFRLGYLHATTIQGAPPASSSDIANLGLTGIFTTLPSYAAGFPEVTFQNFSSFGSPGNVPTTSDIPMWEFSDSLSMVRGKHTIGVGFDYRTWVQKRDLSTNFLGQYTYNNTTILQNSQGGTCSTASGLCGTGNAVADFLLGYYGSASTFQPGPFSSPGVAGNLNQYHFKYFAPYVQDEWKVTNRLTLNLGLRWDYRNVPYETHDKLFWINPENTLGGLCFADKALLSNGIAPAGNGFYDYCGSNTPTKGSKTPFAPRIGFAFRPFGGDKTVVRGGYGIYWDSFETREMDNSGDLYPFVERTTLTPTAQTLAVAPKLTDELFPALTAPLPVTIAAQGGQFIAVILSEHPRNPYVQQWSFSVQRELFRNTTLEVNYVGNKGTHLLDRANINQPFPATNPALCQSDPTAGDCPIGNRRPYVNFSAFATLDSHWDGYSNYNAGNVKLERRASDMAFTAVYTWAKSLDDKSAAAGIGATNGFAGHMNDHDPRADYGPSDFNVGQRFVGSIVYSLPVGRGKRFLSGANKAVDAAIGGWQLTSITTFQQGFPFSVQASDTFGLLNGFNQRADLVPGCNPKSGFTKGINEWFNTSCFTQPLAGAFGTSGRNILREPGINNWDVGLGKTFKFGERVAFQLRVETFNTFNHTQWGVDPGSPTAAASGPGTGAIDRNVNDVPPSPNTNFGKIVSARPGRIVQLGGKITF